ncbi:MAG: hypothetical protein ACI4I9_08135 [Porcipelethomonas sp.]
MTIKEQLRRYRALKLELEEINTDINKNCVKDGVQGSMKNHPYIMQNHKVEGVADEDHELLERKSDIKAQLKAVESFVRSIDDYRIRKAIKIYYMDPVDESCEKPTWESIAEKLKDGSTANSIKMSVSRYLKKSL